MAENIKNKMLTNFQLIGFVVLLLFLGGFLLISSGIFDEAEVKNNFVNQHNHPVEENTNSVDLNVINEINSLEEEVKNNPNNYDALLNLGHLLNDNGFHDRAIEKYNKYLIKFPKNADVLVDLGVCYFEQRKYDEAIVKIKKAIDINPKHQIAHFNLGIVTFSKNDIEAAKEWWQKARDLDPNSNIGQKAEQLLKTNK